MFRNRRLRTLGLTLTLSGLLVGCASSHAVRQAGSSNATPRSVTAPGGTTVGAARGARLTNSGRLLADFEGLLRKQLGHHSVCGRLNNRLGSIDFRTGRQAHHCAPLSTYFAYRYVFRSPRPGGLRANAAVRRQVTRAVDHSDFPDAYPISIDGRFVSCTRQPLRVLLEVNNQPDFTLSCTRI